MEYKPRDHLPRRVTFARGKDKQCSYNPDKKDKVMDKHPWPGFLDFNFYTTCNNGKVTDVYPWPDFLDFEHFSPETGKTHFREERPPILWKGKSSSFWQTPEELYNNRESCRDKTYASLDPGTTIKQEGDPWGISWRPPPVVTFAPMHVMRAHFKAKCFAFLAGVDRAWDRDPKWPIYWHGEHALYYSHKFLVNTDLSEEQMINKVLTQEATSVTKMEAMAFGMTTITMVTYPASKRS